jgi:hypothetical protein
MPLKNMKLKKKKSKNGDDCVECTEDKYPYGLTLSIDNDSIDKLGMKELPKVGGKILLVAEVYVIEVSERETSQDGKWRNVRLQITDMSLEEKSKSKPKALYGDK